MHGRDIQDDYFVKGSYDFDDRGPELSSKLCDDHHITQFAGKVASV